MRASRFVVSLLFVALLARSSYGNVDMFYVDSTGHAIDAIFKGNVDPRFSGYVSSAMKCPRYPRFVFHGLSAFNFTLVSSENSTVTISDKDNSSFSAVVTLEPHLPFGVLAYGDCSSNSWGVKRLGVSYSPADPSSSKAQYDLVFNYNCSDGSSRFDLSVVLLVILAVVVLYFSSYKLRPIGFIVEILPPEFATVNIITVILWMCFFSLLMLALHYAGLYTEFILRVVYTLFGFLSMILVLEDFMISLISNPDNFVHKRVFWKIHWRTVVSAIISAIVSGFYLWTRNYILNDLIAITTAIAIVSYVEVRSFKFGFAFITIIFLFDLLWIITWRDMVSKKTSYLHAGRRVEAPFKLACSRWLSSPYSQCVRIDLGNIVVPAMLIRFLKYFDQTTGLSKKTNYFLVGVVAYIASMLIWLILVLFVPTSLPQMLITGPVLTIAIFAYSWHTKTFSSLLSSTHDQPIPKDQSQFNKSQVYQGDPAGKELGPEREKNQGQDEYFEYEKLNE